MADSKSGFGSELREKIEKAKLALEVIPRKASIELLSSVVQMTPVGNPSLWKVNKTAVEYNNAVSEWNASLRANPANVDSRGRLKRGKKLNDGMDIKAPAGYVGGRLKANWFVSVGRPSDQTTENVDKSGGETISRGAAEIMTAKMSEQPLYIVNNLPYAIPIEYGHSQIQAPNGMVRVTAARWDEYVSRAVKAGSNE